MHITDDPPESSISPPFDGTLGGVFTLPSSDGYNESERFLSALCRRSFLNLWSLPNTYRAANKELIDVLVVFGDDIILFSDKHIRFNSSADLKVAWARWCREAIDESARQLHRAKNWLTHQSDKVFLDRLAEQRIPVDLPSSGQSRFHLVATARGAFEACSDFFQGDYGSLVISTAISDGWDKELPFQIGCVRRKDSFVHVFDEAAVSLVLTELDTAADFVQYLRAREELLDGSRVVMAHGEEQLLAAYLRHHDGSRNWFTPPGEDWKAFHALQFDGSHAAALFGSPQYKQKKKADEVSYVWDRLIETFVRIGNPAHLGIEGVPASNVELALRAMASEPRFMRRTLSDALLSLLESAKRDDAMRQRFRVVADASMQGAAYVFFVFPKRPEISFDEYRAERKERLEIYCRCLLAKHDLIDKVVGLGFDHPKRSYKQHSEDLIVIPRPDYEPGEKEELLKAAESLNILGDQLRMKRMSLFEYPDIPQQRSSENFKSRKRREKNKRQQARRSRRKNRR